VGASTTFDPNVKLYDSVTRSRSENDADEPLFAIGQRVKLIKDIVNDGTYPHSKIGTLMMPEGSIGYIKSMGEFLQVIRVYEVHFLGSDMDVEVVGCRENELTSMDENFVSEEELEREAFETHRKKMNKS
jgi:nitrogen fixation protein NifZ